MEIGEKRKILRPTFLHQGVFIMQNSVVTIQKIEANNITVEWTDSEGGTHLLENVQPQELGTLEDHA